jgi:quercetin dioxygenase-like cupin family protein
VRLLELLAGFQEQDWCKRGHTGYVIGGTLKIEFADGRQQTYGEGEPLLISRGEMHKASVDSGKVRLFLVDDV